MSSCGGDADEARREAALGHERLLGAVGDAAHGARDLDVLGEIEVVGAGLAGRLGDRDVAVVGQARDHRVDRVGGEVLGEGCRIGGVERECRAGCVPAVRAHHRLGGRAVHVGQLDLVTAGFG